MYTSRKRIVVIERDEKLKEMLNVTIEASGNYMLVQQYATAAEAVQRLRKDAPDLIIMNHDGDIHRSTDAISQIKKLQPHIHILVVNDTDEEDVVFASLSAGANGYVLREAWVLHFPLYLKDLAQGGSPLSPNVAKLLVQSMHVARVSPITHREGEVLRLITQGNTYSTIAEELNISKETSKTHIRNIYRKLNVNSLSEVVRKAFEDRIVPMGWNSHFESRVN